MPNSLSPGGHSAFVEQALQPVHESEIPSFEYYAAHFLVGSGLTDGDLDGHVRSLAEEMKKHHERGVLDGMNRAASVD